MSPTPLFRTSQVQEMDRNAAEALGFDSFELMRRAGASAWATVRRRWPDARRIGVACGPGNNGGDGYALANLARADGFEVEVVGISSQPHTADARLAWQEWYEGGGATRGFDGLLPKVDLWVDALFGIGLNRAPEGMALAIIDRLNVAGTPVLALDVPSGVDADSGGVPGEAVRAEATLTFLADKRGLRTGAARDYCGKVLVDPLGVANPSAGFEPAAWLYRAAQLAQALPRRHLDAHKGEHGHVLCVGGEVGMGGAVRLCAEAALRTGVGLASVATRGEGVAALVVARPEAMTHAVEHAEALQPLLARASVVAVGPGLGQGDWGRSLFDAAVASGRPLIVDADALNLLARNPRPLPQAILTPHPGEAARLLGVDTGIVQANRFVAADALVRRFGCTVVLKGAGTLVATPDEGMAVIDVGNPGMATGGMGDVLTGVIAALRAQGMPAFQAALYGALMHGAAGDAAAKVDGERGLLPSDLFPQLRRLSNPG